KGQERTRLLRRKVSLHKAEKRKLPHLTLVLLGLVVLSVLSAWAKGTLPPNNHGLRDDGHIKNESPHEGFSSSSKVESSSDSSHDEGDLLMEKSLMSNLVGEDSDSQRENIFRSRCLVRIATFTLLPPSMDFILGLPQSKIGKIDSHKCRILFHVIKLMMLGSNKCDTLYLDT
ncbi:hypothetical protein CR513_40195, partial [Mucuna pruriens]